MTLEQTTEDTGMMLKPTFKKPTKSTAQTKQKKKGIKVGSSTPAEVQETGEDMELDD